MRTRTSALLLFLLLATAPRHSQAPVGWFRLSAPGGAYIAQSRVPISAEGVSGRYTLAALGRGTIENGTFVAQRVDRAVSAIVVGIANGAVALGTVQIVPPPPPARKVIAVATYRSGIALHDVSTFAPLGNVGIGGSPTDVAFLPNGSFAAADTDGNTLTLISRSPWNMRAIAGVQNGNEIAADSAGNFFVTNRDIAGAGALTRIASDGDVAHVVTGVTAEGLALDRRRGVAYVGNVNDDTIAVVDTASMRVLRKIPTVARPFGLALDEARNRLFVVSNVSPSMKAGGGYVAAIDLATSRAAVRSSAMRFPLGVAFDSRGKRVFVTDEASDQVYVLNSTNLRAVHAPLRTCLTPWRPVVAGGRLYVPCSRADAVDVFALASLRRVRGAPFSTGVYPLGLAVSP